MSLSTWSKSFQLKVPMSMESSSEVVSYGFQAWKNSGTWSPIYRECDGVAWWDIWGWFLRKWWSPKNVKNENLPIKCYPLLACNSFPSHLLLQLAPFWWDHGGPNICWCGFRFFQFGQCFTFWKWFGLDHMCLGHTQIELHLYHTMVWYVFGIRMKWNKQY